MKSLWKYEMHAHTSPISQCSLLPPAILAQTVRRNGYDALVVTDHYTPSFFEGGFSGLAYRRRVHDYFAGFRAAREAGAAIGLTVLPGAELTLTAGPEDFLLYGFNEDIALETGCLCTLTLPEVRKRLMPYGVLLIQAHPYRRYLRCAPAQLLDGVEVYNGNPRHDSQNPIALAFAKDNHLLMTAGSDVHQVSDFGRAWMMLPPAHSEGELAQLLRTHAQTPPDQRDFT